MKIEHLAIWSKDIETLKDFYCKYFGGKAGSKYRNNKTGFESYFISFSSGARLEVMSTPELAAQGGKAEGKSVGLAHFAVSVGTKEMVDALTDRLRTHGFLIASEPRNTGDGYYESCVLDPDGNIVEITE